MPPLARIIGLVVLLAASPAWSAAQTPMPGSSANAPSTAAPAPPFTWDHPLPPSQIESPVAADSTGVVATAYQEPIPSTAAPSASGDSTTEPGPGLRPPVGPNANPNPLAPPKKAELPPLSPQGRSRPEGSPHKPSGLPSLSTTAGSLAVVLGLFFVFAWAVRRTNPGGSTILPSDVLEVLGRAPVAARQQVYLIRCGKKLVLVHVCPEGVETLTEITELDEVERLEGLCRQAQPQRAAKAFRQVFQQFARERTEPDFTAESYYDDARLTSFHTAPRSHGRQEDDHV